MQEKKKQADYSKIKALYVQLYVQSNHEANYEYFMHFFNRKNI